MKRAPWLLVILLLTVLAYRSVLSAGFVYEDTNWLPFTQWPLSSLGYSLTYAPFALAQWLGGGQPWAYHAVVLGLHLVNVCLVYWLGVRLGAGVWAGIAAAIFAWHPIQGEAVAYITGGREVVAAFFLLSALLIGSVESWGWQAFWTGLGVTLCAGLAVLSKASAITALPLVVYALCLMRAWRTLAAFGVGGVLVLLGQWHDIHHLLVAHDGVHWASTSYAAMQASALWRYTLLFIAPFGTSIDHDWAQATPALHLVALISLIAWSVLIVWNWRTYSHLAMALGWVLIAVAPRFFLETREVLNEHQLYTPLIGVSLAIALACAKTELVKTPYPVWLAAGDPL